MVKLHKPIVHLPKIGSVSWKPSSSTKKDKDDWGADDWYGDYHYSSGYSYSGYKDPWIPELRAARSTLLRMRGYLSTLLWMLQPVPGLKLPTVAIDKHLRLYYNEDTFLSWSVPQRAGALYHEVLHRKRQHDERFDEYIKMRAGKGQKKPDPMLWNLAADLEINDDIIAEPELELPDGAMLPGLFGLEDNKTAEEYYAQLERMGAGQGGDGDVVTPESIGENGQTEEGKKCGCGSFSAAPEPESGELERLAREAGAYKRARSTVEWALDETASSIEGAVSQGIGIGDQDGSLLRWAQQRRLAKYDWRRELNGQLGDVIRGSLGASRSTYHRPSRRQDASPEVLFPARVSVLPSVVVFADTSGSMSQSDLEEVTRQIPAIIQAVGGNCMFAPIDTRAGKPEKINRTSKINLSGGGGTDMRQAVWTAEKMSPRPEICIVLTDGMSPWEMDKPSGLHVIVGIIGPDISRIENVRTSCGIPAWMRVIPIPKGD